MIKINKKDSQYIFNYVNGIFEIHCAMLKSLDEMLTLEGKQTEYQREYAEFILKQTIAEMATVKDIITGEAVEISTKDADLAASILRRYLKDVVDSQEKENTEEEQRIHEEQMDLLNSRGVDCQSEENIYSAAPKILCILTVGSTED